MSDSLTMANGRPGAPRPFSYTPLENLDGSERLTNTEATRLMREVMAWASQFKNENSDAFVLCDAMRDMERRLLTRVGTEIDESLHPFDADGKTAGERRRASSRSPHVPQPLAGPRRALRQRRHPAPVGAR